MGEEKAHGLTVDSHTNRETPMGKKSQVTQQHSKVLSLLPQLPPFQMGTSTRKYKERVFCMQGYGAPSKSISDAQANVCKSFKNKTKHKNLDFLFFSLLLIIQSHLGCLLIDRAKEPRGQ